MKTEIAFRPNPMPNEGYDVFVIRYGLMPGQPQSELLVCNWEPREINSQPDPSFHVDNDTVQAMMDSLWGSGVRPTDYAGPQVLEAQGKHLNDMRTIVSKKLGVEL